MRISEAQAFLRKMLKTYNIKKSTLASLTGVLEELGELASDLLVKEGYKIKSSEIRLDYKAKIFFKLLKLTEDYDIDLENALEY